MALLLCLALPLNLFFAATTPQQPPSCSVTGIVENAAGEPLAQTQVSLTPGGHVTETGADGRYCFAAIAPGHYTIIAELAGFSELQIVDIVDAAMPARIDLVLGAQVYEELIVTASRTPRGLEDTVVRTEIIGQESMNAVAARTLADAVEYTTGVRVESNCQNCNFSQIRMLGLAGPYTQILMDGQPLISSLAQVYGIEQIPTRMVDRIEVVKGGGSALFGPGAVGGIVNVVPRNASRTGGGFELGLGVGSGHDPSRRASGSFDWVSGSRSTRVTGFTQIDRIAPHDIDGDGFTEVSQRDLDAFGARLNRRAAGSSGNLMIDFNHTYEYRRGGDQLERPAHEAFIAEEIRSRRNSFSVGWRQHPDENLDYSLTASLSAMHRSSYYGTFMDPNAYGDTDSRLAVVDARFNRYVGRGHVISWGGQIRDERLRDRQPAYDRVIDADYRSAGFFGQWDVAMASGWQIVAGLRLDKHSTIDHTIASPRLAVMFSPRENLDFRASVATGFRPPQAFDEDLHLSAAGGEPLVIFLSRQLREERSHSFMLGAEWKPVVGRGQGLVEVNAFFTRLQDLFHNIEADDPGTGIFEFLKVNLGDAAVYGIETNLGWGIGDTVILQGGIVFQRARYRDPDPDWGSRDFLRTPAVYGNLSATWSAGVANLFLGGRYTGPMQVPHYAGWITSDRLQRTRSFLEIDLSASKPIRAGARVLALQLAVRNLTNAYQPDLDRGPLRDASYVYGPRLPRNLQVGLRVDF